MKNDLKNFELKNNLLCLNASPNRLFVFIESQDQVELIDNFRLDYPIITVLSSELFKFNLPKSIVTTAKKIEKNTHPIDPSVYQILGKGFKDYDYYVTSLIFIE